ncbi:MAG TPA: endopeptidase La [Candidatus Scybalomonas excrementigallinarum]|nr:endopeptidase La [Candidatus Scybalomonas excrementigallinarum]
MEEKMMETLKMPMIALRGTVVFPKTVVHFDVSREKSVQAVENAMKGEQLVFLSAQMDDSIEDPKREDIYSLGVVAKIKQIIKLPGNVIRVLVEGENRARLVELLEEEPYLYVEVEQADTVLEAGEIDDEHTKEAMVRSLKDIIQAYGFDSNKATRNVVGQILEIQDLEELIFEIATQLPINVKQKQVILEEDEIIERGEKLLVTLAEEIEIYQIRKEIQEKIKEKVDKNQKDYILREQMKVIREELGEGSEAEADEFEEKVEKLDASEEVKEKIRKEISRFKNSGGMSAESYVSRNYIETMLEMPWNHCSEDNNDIKSASKILEEDHYGLEKVKERIIEFLAVRSLTEKGEAPIICLAGPPGTGKTSIARSIARAVNKHYVRISLGGIRDEAEIRGHRKTYVGAMPGRIATGIKQAGVKNPLMLLDEIDKVSSDYKGDTASALLEVLDGEQNVTFMDHYLEVPIDLSEVLFVATANDLSTIPRPLLDRMEVIEVSSYTENEKFHIAKRYLVEKQLKKNGLTKEQLIITDKAIRKVISSYTREAGVRNLERKIGQICRKAARMIMEGNKTHLKVLESNVSKFLGTEIFSKEDEDLTPKTGIVRGLAWTSVGGDTLSVEVNIMAGKGKFELTGNLGDVMKESARTGISYIRSVANQYGIEDDYFEKHDIHIHIPEGAVPKDGPSAGITMATAILSAITGKKVRGDIAMTGEITLRGRVLPIGGLKEKILAAKVVGVKEVIVPVKNKKNVADIDKEITSGLTITYATTMEDVLEHALVKDEK